MHQFFLKNFFAKSNNVNHVASEPSRGYFESYEFWKTIPNGHRVNYSKHGNVKKSTIMACPPESL